MTMSRRRERPNFAALGRAVRYLGHYRRLALTILGLDVANLAQQLRVAHRPLLARAA